LATTWSKVHKKTKQKTLFDLRYSNGSFTSPVSQVYISRIIYEKVKFGGYLLYAQLP
jgi:hypothetical protein